MKTNIHILLFVLSSIPDPMKALNEVERVLKPGSKAIFIEHVLSKNLLIVLSEHLHNPFTKLFFGFIVNRKYPEKHSEFQTWINFW